MPSPQAGGRLDTAAKQADCSASDRVAGWEAVRQDFAGNDASGTNIQVAGHIASSDQTHGCRATLSPDRQQNWRSVGALEHTRLYLQSLLQDRRSDRSGFPAEVMLELQALQQYYFEHLSGLPAVLWNAVPIKEPKLPKKIFASAARNAEIEILPLPSH